MVDSCVRQTVSDDEEVEHSGNKIAVVGVDTSSLQTGLATVIGCLDPVVFAATWHCSTFRLNEQGELLPTHKQLHKHYPLYLCHVAYA